MNRCLDEFESIQGKVNTRSRKNELLRMAGMASVRAVRALKEDMRTREPYPPPDEITRELREMMRQDRALVDLFIDAELRLLRGIGVDRRALVRIRVDLDKSIERILHDETLLRGDAHQHSETQDVQLTRLIDELETTLQELDEVCRHLEIAESTWHRWVAQYGGMKANDAKRLKELEAENARLKKMVANQALDIDMLKEISAGNF
ncbi:Transposase [Mycobacterium marinum]|nr:Transposase [Mycobacterium marinum]